MKKSKRTFAAVDKGREKGRLGDEGGCPMETILLIDDDRELGDLLREYLEPEGFLLGTLPKSGG